MGTVSSVLWNNMHKSNERAAKSCCEKASLLRRGVVRLGALASRVAVVQDGERGADGAGRRGGAEPAAAAGVHPHLVRRQRDGQRRGVGLQQSPGREKNCFTNSWQKSTSIVLTNKIT